MIYNYYKCPTCGCLLEGLVENHSKGVGQPFRICPKCSTYVIMNRLFNEWVLLSNTKKKWMYFRLYYSVFMLGAFGGFLIGAAGILLLYPNTSVSNVVFIGIVSSIIGFTSYLAYTLNWFKKEIKKSNDRMADHSYVRLLRALGLDKIED